MTEFRITSPDADVLTFNPPQGDEWIILVEVYIHEEKFQFELCSVEWFVARVEQFPMYFTSHMAVCTEYSYEALVEGVKKLILQAQNQDWVASATTLHKNMFWELSNSISKPKRRSWWSI